MGVEIAGDALRNRADRAQVDSQISSAALEGREFLAPPNLAARVQKLAVVPEGDRW